MWAFESVFYQIYPMGLCGAPFENDGIPASRILKLEEYAEHIASVGANAVYFSPLFESDSHGYDTRNYKKLDTRLGTNEDFKKVCTLYHEKGIKIVLDGVFNHVGRGFAQFRDVLEKREASPYKDWFFINFDGNSCYNDGLWYEGWEGHFELVKLNLRNEAVINHIFDAVKFWIEEFDIDGLRLDVAYCIDRDFLKRLRAFTESIKPGFFLAGEMIHGDYNTIVNDEMCHSATNYECYKGLHSSFNSMNMFEIVHSLLRQFGPENWTLYKGKHLFSFVDNHDVSRIATVLNDKNHIPLIYSMLFAMPGIPCIYYGSEWGAEGDKKNGDPSLRPYFEKPESNSLTEYISVLAEIRKNSSALNYGGFRSVVLSNKHCIFERKTENETVLVAINADSQPVTCYFDAGAMSGTDLISGEKTELGGKLELGAYSAKYIRL